LNFDILSKAISNILFSQKLDLSLFDKFKFLERLARAIQLTTDIIEIKE